MKACKNPPFTKGGDMKSNKVVLDLELFMFPAAFYIIEPFLAPVKLEKNLGRKKVTYVFPLSICDYFNNIRKLGQ
jgi:hypothetical protein